MVRTVWLLPRGGADDKQMWTAVNCKCVYHQGISMVPEAAVDYSMYSMI
jgi:hypothetical protein